MTEMVTISFGKKSLLDGLIMLRGMVTVEYDLSAGEITESVPAETDVVIINPDADIRMETDLALSASVGHRIMAGQPQTFHVKKGDQIKLIKAE